MAIDKIGAHEQDYLSQDWELSRTEKEKQENCYLFVVSFLITCWYRPGQG